MLSFVYRLMRDFEKEHGIRPNLLYLNPVHMHFLREQMRSNQPLDEIVRLLGMEIIITREALHPHVAWTQSAGQRKAV